MIKCRFIGADADQNKNYKKSVCVKSKFKCAECSSIGLNEVQFRLWMRSASSKSVTYSDDNAWRWRADETEQRQDEGSDKICDEDKLDILLVFDRKGFVQPNETGGYKNVSYYEILCFIFPHINFFLISDNSEFSSVSMHWMECKEN